MFFKFGLTNETNKIKVSPNENKVSPNKNKVLPNKKQHKKNIPRGYRGKKLFFITLFLFDAIKLRVNLSFIKRNWTEM